MTTDNDQKPTQFYVHQSQIPPGTIRQLHLDSTDTIANGDFYYGTGNNTFKRLPVGSNGQLLTVQSGVPSWGLPSYTTTQRNALTGVVKGTIIYNLTTNKLNVFTGSWEAITSA